MTQARSTLRLHVTRDINADIERLPAAEVMNKTAGRNDTYAVNGLHPAEPRITFFQRPEVRSFDPPGWVLPDEWKAEPSRDQRSEFQNFHWLPTMVYRILDLTTLVSSSEPVNALIVRALLNLYQFYGDDFKVECPTGSGQYMTLFEVAEEIGRRLTATFLRDTDGKRPVYGETAKFQQDPHWRDLILFYEYFHGDNGAGLGASHQTGWTGLVAPMLDIFGRADAKTVLETEMGQLADKLMREQVSGEQPHGLR